MSNYQVQIDPRREDFCGILKTENGVTLSIPLNPANRHYQAVLDAIIEQGADCFDGDIPEDLQAAADAKLAAGLYQPDPHA